MALGQGFRAWGKVWGFRIQGIPGTGSRGEDSGIKI
jgi:hypothetical protein